MDAAAINAIMIVRSLGDRGWRDTRNGRGLTDSLFNNLPFDHVPTGHIRSSHNHCVVCDGGVVVDKSLFVMDAECRNHDPEWWFPFNMFSPEAQMAVKICQSCPVMHRCHDYAVRERIGHGIWGGVSFGVLKDSVETEALF